MTYFDSSGRNNTSYHSEDYDSYPFVQSPKQWNLEGSVHFRGKPCPPSAFYSVPPCSGPYPNYELNIYAEDGKTLISKTKTDSIGNFRMSLKSGKYIIYTRAGPTLGDIKSTHVTIEESGITRLPTLTVDTGLA